MKADSGPDPDRKTLLALCRAALAARKGGYLRELESLDEAAAGETKSSAGDKYETAREMIAQTRALMARNLAETEAGLRALDRMESAAPGSKVGFGTLVETSLGWYLVGVSLGELESGGKVVRTLTMASPLGEALRGREAGESVPWREGALEILRIAV